MRRQLQILLFLISPTVCLAQQAQPQPSGTPPPDRQLQVQAEAVKQFEESLKPYIEKARKTYPDAKKKFLKGLPPGESFSVTTKIYDDQGKFEQSFIRVKEIRDGMIKGVIANEMNMVTKYKEGDAYSFPEKDLIDWTISKPDGSEEGNVVGKYIDSMMGP